MAEIPDDDIVQQWNDLVARWDTANRKSAASSAAGLGGRKVAEFEEVLRSAMEELKELKREIDQTIQRRKRSRGQIPGTLVMGTLEQHQLHRQGKQSSARSIRLYRDQE